MVTVPRDLKPGDVFHVSTPGAVSSLSSEMGVDEEEVRLALQMSLSSMSGDTRSLQRARDRTQYIKPLALIWACREFASFYNEANTVIVDDTLDVCGGNPHNIIQC